VNDILNSFDSKNSLNKEIWDNADLDNPLDTKLNREIRSKLLDIADKFLSFIDIEGFDFEDVLLVGSLSNYNWSSYSDFDLHILVDYSSVTEDKEVVANLMKVKKDLFNLRYDIKIKNFDVELYAQDVDENLESNGIYSVLFGKWISFPEKTPYKLDKSVIKKKIKVFKNRFNDIKNIKDKSEKIKAIETLLNTIKKYRKCGLEKDGEFSNENIVFKYLRRSKLIDELVELKLDTETFLLSLDN
jgi:hypothetical protein